MYVKQETKVDRRERKREPKPKSEGRTDREAKVNNARRCARLVSDKVIYFASSETNLAASRKMNTK